MECTKVTYRSSVGDMDIPAYLFQPLNEARRQGPCRHGLGPRRRARQLEHFVFPVREGSRAARLRHHRARVSRQHRLRRSAPPGHRLRRQGSRRRDERGRLPQDAAARRRGAHRHDGLEPRRLHHAALGLPRPAPVQGRRRDRAGHEPRLPPVVQGPGLSARLLDAAGGPRPAVREAGAVHRSARRSITSTS